MGAGSSGTKQRCSKAAGLCRSPEDHGSRGGSSGSPTTPGRHLEAPWHEDSVGRRQLHASSPVWLRSVLSQRGTTLWGQDGHREAPGMHLEDDVSLSPFQHWSPPAALPATLPCPGFATSLAYLLFLIWSEANESNTK